MNEYNTTQGNDYITSPATFPPHIAILLYSILLVWSLLGNVLVIAVVYCNENLRTNMNYLIVNMAVSDLLVPLVAMPWMISKSSMALLPRERASLISYASDEWLVEGPLGEALCKLVPFLSQISPLVSSISLVVIAVHRYIAVVYPTRIQLSSRKTRYIAISLPWIVAMLLCAPPLYIFQLEERVCLPKGNDYEILAIISIIMRSFVGFVIPLIVIVILYTIIVYRLRESLKNIMDMVEKETIHSRQRRNRRIFGMLITIVVMFVICWTLVVVIPMIEFHFVEGIAVQTLFFATGYMWYLQAAINPSIYFVFLRDFRKGLKTLFCSRIAPARGRDGNEEPMQHLHPNTPNQILDINSPTRARTPGGDSNQDPTCTPPHINTTSV